MSDMYKGYTGPVVTAPTLADGVDAYVRLNNSGAVLISALHGRWYELTRRGMVFIASTAIAGLALPIYSATAQLFMIWNPANSGYNLELICAAFGKVSTTGSDGHICWGYKTGMGSGLGTPCSAYTAGTPVNALLGANGDTVTNFAPATATVTAPSYLRNSGITQTEVADAQISPPYQLVEDFEKNPLIIAPGSAIFACQSIAASTVWGVAVTYARVPV